MLLVFKLNVEVVNTLKGIKGLRNEYPHSANHVKWLSDTLYLLEDIFGRNSRIYLTIASLTWQPSGRFSADRYNIEQEIQRHEQIAFLKQLEIAEGILESGIQQIRNKGVGNVYDGKDTARNLN